MPKRKLDDVNAAIVEKVRKKFLDLNPSLAKNTTFNYFTENLPKYLNARPDLDLLESYKIINPDMDERTIKLLEEFKEHYSIESGLENIVAPKKGEVPASKPEKHSPQDYSGELKDNGIYTLAKGAKLAGIDIKKVSNAKRLGNLTTVKHPILNKIVTTGFALKILRERPRSGFKEYDMKCPQPTQKDIYDLIKDISINESGPSSAGGETNAEYNPEGILNSEKIMEILGMNKWGLKHLFQRHPELKIGEDNTTTQEKLAKYVLNDKKTKYPPNSKLEILKELGFTGTEKEAAKQLGVEYNLGKGEQKIEVFGLKKLNCLIAGLPSTVIPGVILAAKLPLDLVIEEGHDIADIPAAVISQRTRRIMDNYGFLEENKQYHKEMNKAYMIGRDFANKFSAAIDMEKIKAAADSLKNIISGV